MTVNAAGLPRNELPAAKRLYRIHRAENDPWFFDGSVNGRFNPVGSPERGACYWAEDPLGAFVEAYRTLTTIASDDIDSRRLATIALPEPLVVVDLTQRSGLAAGATASLTAGADHTAAQVLADQLQGEVDGVLWRSRHDFSGRLTSIALFGPKGGRAAAPGLPRSTSAVLSGDLLAQAAETFAYRTLPRPA